MIMAFDTETTGMASFKLPAEADCQPRIAQLGIVTYNDAWEEQCSLNLLVQPFGFDIPVEATAIHGITSAHALRYGVPETVALDMFDILARQATIIIAHNIKYDTLVMRRAWFVHRRAGTIHELYAKGFCTMDAMTRVCKLPSRFKDGDFKWPTLQEAYTFCFKRPFVGAHDAMADVRACAEVYRWYKEQSNPKVNATLQTTDK